MEFIIDSCFCLMSKCILTSQALCKKGCGFLSRNISYEIYRRFLLLFDVAISFDCVDLHKLFFLVFFDGSREGGVLSCGPATKGLIQTNLFSVLL